jgi:methyltransferase (TIGR00027 family)
VQPSDRPDSTAVRVALWRALHVQLDAPPHVLEDDLGLKLASPEEGWRQRGDMHPLGTRGYRTAVVARARFIEDLVTEQVAQDVTQYVLLGAGLDTFAQRRLQLASRMQIFEVDQPGPQAWKRRRLDELGLGVPPWLHLVPVDFETEIWWERLVQAGFDAARPAVVAVTGVTMYLTREAIAAMLRQVATLVRGSTLAMTFLLPPDLVDPVERAPYEAVIAAARGSGTPFLSLLPPCEVLAMARQGGFRQVQHVATGDLYQRYFAGRQDGLKPADGESFLLATT